MTKELIINLDSGKLLDNLHSTKEKSLRELSIAPDDIHVIDIIPVRESGLLDPLYIPESWTGSTIEMGIGRPRRACNFGSYQLTYGGDSTPAIGSSPVGVDSNMAAIESALNSLDAINSAGGVKCKEFSRRYKPGAFFLIEFNAAGTRTAFTAADLGLSPAGEVAIDIIVTGTSTVREVVQVSVFERLLVHSSSFSAAAATALSVTVNTTGDGSTKEVETLELTPLPIGGLWIPIIDGTTLTTRIPWDASAAEFDAALTTDSISATVQKIGRSKWLISFDAVGARTQATADLTSLILANRYRATVDFDTASLDSALRPIDSVLQLQVTASGSTTRETVLSIPFSFAEDAINDQTTI
jgi:hypothetical protein